MPSRSVYLVTICAIAGSLATTPLLAQTCVGLPTDRGAVTFGLEGTDGATGMSGGLVVGSGRLSTALQYSSLHKFAQDDDVASIGAHLAWRLTGGPIAVCAVGGAEWTSYEAGSSSLEWTDAGTRYREYFVSGDFNRIRTPIGFSLGRELRADHRLTFTPLMTVALVHDYERMRWADGGLESRSSFGTGATLGLALRLDPVFLRIQVGNLWSERRALSGHNDRATLTAQLGWAF